ncbi:MAG TPA: glycogen debranching protein GlgX, partial [Thermoanaerobaculaceae bacterium]|nr:glycogen debranching protein GlgX [Thermoanaerobaculaceae bacterium]
MAETSPPAGEVSAGHFHPLGATPAPGGVNFALLSRRATAVDLLLFDGPGDDATRVIPVTSCTRFVWHVFVPGLSAGQLYGYRVRGPFDPAHGLRFAPAKLLVDPYAKALAGKAVNTANLLLAYDPDAPGADLTLDARDDARIVPKAVVVDDAFDWQGDEPMAKPFEHLLVYEVHVKGFTAHPSSGVAQPGTYLGLVEKIPHLQRLGVNAVELLPVHEHVDDDFLLARGLVNYWGYNTLAFFAPESSYAAGKAPGSAVAEFKTMVRELHRAGIEVILDVVYNHTAEGSELGPTLSLRGIDNPSYYCLSGPPEAPGRFYENYTGCGNSLDLNKPDAIRLVMDSLRYWVEVMHVDGFRFDLASVLGREEDGTFRSTSSFFDAVYQDPALSCVKLIAEPWDVGTYQSGNFPVDWSEWNGRFRDTVRRFVRGDGGQVGDLATRLTGSADLYSGNGRTAFNSVNFVTCHDGFTLADLVSFDDKHNQANQEGDSDGTDANFSWNCGVEGASDDPEVNRLRRAQAKNLACLLLFSAGTPMMLGGDELLRTQGGNNNAYCQDNPTSWFDWGLAERNADFLEFFRKAVALPRRLPVLQRRHFFTGTPAPGAAAPDIAWFGPDLRTPRWDDPELRALAFQLAGSGTPAGEGDYRVFVILNAAEELQDFGLPPLPAAMGWRRVVDTSLPAGLDFAEPGGEVPIDPPGHYLANPRSTVVLLAR